MVAPLAAPMSIGVLDFPVVQVTERAAAMVLKRGTECRVSVTGDCLLVAMVAYVATSVVVATAADMVMEIKAMEVVRGP